MRENVSRNRLLGNRIEEFAENLNDPENSKTRREVLLVSTMNAASLAIATGLVGKFAFDKSKESEIPYSSSLSGEIYPQNNEKIVETENPDWWKKVEYITPKKLVGSNVDNPLEGSYIRPDPTLGTVDLTHLPKIIGPIAFHQNEKRMIKAKGKLLEHNPHAKEEIAFLESLGDSYAEKFEKKEIRKMNLREFRALIEKESRTVSSELQKSMPLIVKTYLSKHLDGTGWAQGTAEREKYESAMAQCLVSLAARITPEIMQAYITTELMPSPERGTAMLEFLTEHAGVEFIEIIPALGDNQLSFGPFQLTPDAVADVVHLQKIMHADLIPTSLEKFSKIEDHLRTGFLFAFHNLLALVQEACREGRYEEVITIVEASNFVKADKHGSVFMEFISAAHHRPGVAQKVMGRWLGENKSVPQLDRAKTLTSYFAPNQVEQEVRTYAEKARHCLENIQRV
jgi:hypothetical protein